MTEEDMFALAQGLAEAKSRQEIPAAMHYLHPDMVLESPFGTPAHGTKENKDALKRFFGTFPDYHVALEGHASDGVTLICWGRVKMTMTGDRFGVQPSGRRADLPVFIAFTFREDLIASERFFFVIVRSIP